MDGPKDMRFAMTARAVARQRSLDEELESSGHSPRGLNEITLKNVKKVIKFRQDGQRALQNMVRQFEKMGVNKEEATAR